MTENWIVFSHWRSACAERVEKETPDRFYYGEVQKTWAGKTRQSFIRKDACLVHHVSKEVAHSVMAIYNAADIKRRDIETRARHEIAAINIERDKAIADSVAAETVVA